MTLDSGAACTLGDAVADVVKGGVGICVGCGRDEGADRIGVGSNIAGVQAVKITLSARLTIRIVPSLGMVTHLFSKYTA